MPTDLTTFGLTEMLRCSVNMRRAASDCATMESAAGSLCRFFFDELRDPGGNPACALVRCYKTHPYTDLAPDLREFARGILGSVSAPPHMKCLTLLATRGIESAWNSRLRSTGHRAIPLPSKDIVERAPMIAQLIRAFGLDISQVVEAESSLMDDLEGRTYGVFHVAEAKGSPYIPAQDFVERYGIRSAIGFGGPLPTGELFAFIIFTTVPVAPDAADRFRSLALDAKWAFLKFGNEAVFGGSASAVA